MSGAASSGRHGLKIVSDYLNDLQSIDIPENSAISRDAAGRHGLLVSTHGV
jgi:hypothetical protein